MGEGIFNQEKLNKNGLRDVTLQVTPDLQYV